MAKKRRLKDAPRGEGSGAGAGTGKASENECKRTSAEARNGRNDGAATLEKTISSKASRPAQTSGRSSNASLSDEAASDGHTTVTSVTDTSADDDDESTDMDDEEEDSDDDTADEDGPLQWPPHSPGSTEENDVDAVSIFPRSVQRRSKSGSQASSGLPDVAASTRSLWTQELDYREIHGRRYCRDYYMPNDELEQLRLSLVHQVFLHVFDGELTTAPLQNPTNILDVGCGTGDWAIRMAELYPQCEVVGMDISAIAETKSVPINVFFEVEDAEEWSCPPQIYDLVHMRYMEGAFRDWADLYKNVFLSLKPGGWIEVQDSDSSETVARYSAVIPEDSPLRQLYKDTDLAAERAGYPRGVKHLDPRVLEAAGFVDVEVKTCVVPVTIAEESAGKIWLIARLDAIEATCLRLLTEQMGWDPEACKAACERSARDLADLERDAEKNEACYITVRTATARRPVEDKHSEADTF